MPKPYIPNDAWSRKAAQEGYRARSVYKLMELDERFHLLKPGMTVLDLAAAPGSWLQYASKRIGPKGLAIGIDLQDIEPVADNVTTLKVDITKFEEVTASIDQILKQKTSRASLTSETSSTFDVVLSDIAPQTSGIKDVDQWRSLELNRAVLDIASRWLKPGGTCVLKVFRGADFDAFLADLKRDWRDVTMLSPHASRDRSREVYVIMRKT